MLMQTSELAKAANVSVRTIQYYDRIGLLKPVQTKDNGYRYYDESSLQHLREILSYKTMDLSLKQIADILNDKNSKRTMLLEQKKALSEKRKQLDLMEMNISRLGRSTRDLLSIIDKLTAKGVKLVSSKENIDTDTPQGRFMLSIFAALSELEREQTLQRQREGIEIAKVQGKYKGRQPIQIDWGKFGQLYHLWKSDDITAREFQHRMGLKANIFYRRAKEYESQYASIGSQKAQNPPM